MGKLIKSYIRTAFIVIHKASCPVFYVILGPSSFIQRILQECSCFIEFIKQDEEKRANVRLAKHLISFSQQV